ncbi:YceD family protein [Shimia abyssi]|uniref:Uncharacterized metal-binding protein YceD (DUF177 family) n=1 Tax=Shimia abyssi TaxID=1662395 RepID=A0A2P8FIS2_9RHOB|nr:DUF177 domain-containing protein [Shimia abyssi]PSL21597.1 uncharacterized metal-binding protein YceD (DUF177 family) [Shimia abyssi]
MPQQTPKNPVYRVADLPQNRVTRFDLRPDPETMTEIATSLGLIGLRKLSFKGELSAFGKSDWQLAAHLGASVVQPCVVTLDPVTTRIEADIERLFLAKMPEWSDEEEVEMPENENADTLGSEIDIGLVMQEALALYLPLYPRAEGAELGETVFTEPGKQAMTDQDARPFAGLAALRGKLGDESEN